ncbi:hypothetical protein SEA_AMETHYST_63 [Streptomyces phage Amethyst]|uniref:Uncharacterized protein n=1 Tax=Streptomyces phage Amethyst TaxID=2041205 RepID=A0A291LI37_9CAUD|nr:hypothetical protein KGG83_gp63 [Streptomyces phage Amethyst]ATI18684.1 hypothetical protein SEA_AMETHYST_63 [Streptomyces phage Amethyst]
MTRERDGWEYTRSGPRWAPTVEGAISALIYDKYGEEYEWWHSHLMDLVRATQRDCSERITTAMKGDDHVVVSAYDAAKLIFPEYPEDPSE